MRTIWEFFGQKLTDEERYLFRANLRNEREERELKRACRKASADIKREFDEAERRIASFEGISYSESRVRTPCGEAKFTESPVTADLVTPRLPARRSILDSLFETLDLGRLFSAGAAGDVLGELRIETSEFFSKATYGPSSARHVSMMAREINYLSQNADDVHAQRERLIEAARERYDEVVRWQEVRLAELSQEIDGIASSMSDGDVLLVKKLLGDGPLERFFNLFSRRGR